jgi:hypothetical protein
VTNNAVYIGLCSDNNDEKPKAIVDTYLTSSSRTRIYATSTAEAAITTAYPDVAMAFPKRTGKWTEDEVIKLKDAIQTHGGKKRGAIATMVPGRTKKQRLDEWKHTPGGRTRRSK